MGYDLSFSYQKAQQCRNREPRAICWCSSFLKADFQLLGTPLPFRSLSNELTRKEKGRTMITGQINKRNLSLSLHSVFGIFRLDVNGHDRVASWLVFIELMSTGATLGHSKLKQLDQVSQPLALSLNEALNVKAEFLGLSDGEIRGIDII